MKKNLFGIFLFVVVVFTVIIFAFGVYYRNNLDNRTNAATPNFPNLPSGICQYKIMNFQPDVKTNFSENLTVKPGQSFRAAVTYYLNGTFVSTNASILMQAPDGTITTVSTNGDWQNATLNVPGSYIFVGFIGTDCKTNYAYLTVSGTPVSTTASSTTSTSSTAEVVNPTINDPALPGTTGATKTVCASGCDFHTIQDAVRDTPNKGKLYIKNGTYTTNFFFTDQGALEVTVEGESVDGVIIDGSSNAANVCNTGTFDKLGGIYLIKNLTIKSSGGCAGISVGRDNATTNDVNFTADNVKVINSKGAGIYFKGASLGKVTNSTFTSNTYAGVSVHQNAQVKVLNSTFSNQTNQAIDLKDNSQGYFESNTIDNNGSATVEQVLLMNTALAEFKTNTFKNTKYTAFRVMNTAKLRSENDVFDGTTQSKKYIADSTAQVTLINSTSSGSTTSDSNITTSCLTYDFNKDGKVDILDFAEWRVCYLKTGADVLTASGCGFADLTHDNKVDIIDFANFVVGLNNYRSSGGQSCTK